MECEDVNMDTEEKASDSNLDQTQDGFQKASRYLNLLPIPIDKLNADADRYFQLIKNRLSSAVLLLDIKQGARYWASQLQRYIKIYSLRFTKQEHIDLVKLLFQLVVTPDQECSVTYIFISVFNKLLQKKKLLSPDDLSLPWKPVYDLWHELLNNKDDSHGRRFIPPYAENMVMNFIKQCRVYFPVEATQEILDKFKPYICPFDNSMNDAFEVMALFLPTTGPLERHSRMYKLWFDEFMGIYVNLDGSRLGWESKILSLFSRLSGHNIGLIDWEPHIPHIFARILRAFGLPVGPAKYQLSHADPSYEFSSVFLWVVAMVTPTNSAMAHIAQFLHTVEPFLHPSNHGWSQRGLHGAISKLCQLFTARVKLERYKKPTWDNYVPREMRLTDDQISQFVDLVKPLIFTGLFSKHGPQDMTSCLFNLAFLRPEKLLPLHLENLYQALENLTEPHRLKATLLGTIAVCRALVTCTDSYPEGRLQVIPLLQLCLPGIDSNDSSKTVSTFQLITMLSALTPLADCSEAHLQRTDLSELERELCSQTTQLQDFIFIFIDRIFVLIEGLALDHHESAAARSRSSMMEAMIESVLKTASISLFQQMSRSLFKLSFEKVWNYISNRVFEVLVAGKLVTALVYGMVKAQPSLTLPHIIPHCCKNILDLTNNADVCTDERPDNALLWNLLLISECMLVTGSVLLPYTEDISTVLDRTLHMTNTTGHLFSCALLERFIKTVGGIYPNDLRSIEHDLDQPLSQYLPIRDWGFAPTLSQVKVDWHIPTSEALNNIQDTITRFLLPELKYLDENVDCDREDLQRRLKIIADCLKNIGLYLPTFQSDPHVIESEGAVDTTRYKVQHRITQFTVTLEGENTRNRVMQTIHPLMVRLLSKDDSAKPLSIIAVIYASLLLNFGVEIENVNQRAKNVKTIKHSLGHPLHLAGSQVRMVHVECAYVQLCRMIYLQSDFDPFTQLHATIYNDLVLLATSRYEDVQSMSRRVLAKCFQEFKSSQRVIVPDICKLLITPPPEVTEEQFKGALGLVYNAEGSMTSPYYSLAVLRDTVVQRQLWPAIVQAQHSEKPNIQLLVDKIIKKIEKHYETNHFTFPVTEGSKSAAQVIQRKLSQPVELDLAAGESAARVRTEKYKGMYVELRDELMSLIYADVLQWKHKEFAMELVAFLQRNDLDPTVQEVALFSRSLIDDAVSVRKLAIGVVTGILFHHKGKHPKEYVASTAFKSYTALQYDPNNVPDTEEKWAETSFVEKTYWGCKHWPDKVPITRSHPPPSPSELPEVQRLIYTCFSDVTFTLTLFKYLSLQDREKDKFSNSTYSFFKALARNYGPAIVECCKEAIAKLQSDTDHLTESSRQRLVAEFVAGVVRGSKYWSFNQMNELFDWLLPTVKKAITNVSDEAITHWGTSIATCCEDREPKKLYRLYQFLLEEVQTVDHDSSSATSLQTSSRLYFLQAALGQQQWRIPELNAYTTQLIKERLACPFKSIRTRLGSVLCSCYIFDIPYMDKHCWHNPKRAELINSVLPLVKELEESTDKELGATSDCDSNAATPLTGLATPTSGLDTPTSGKDTPSSEESTLGVVSSALAAIEVLELETNMEVEERSENSRKKLIFKTVLSWLHSNFERYTMYQKWTPEILKFIPIICPHTANYSDPELRSLAQNAVKYMSKTLLPQELVSDFIHVIREAIGLESWHARTTVLELLQPMIFLNQFTLSDYTSQIQDIVVHLLSDERIEVKLAAATTLSGGIQCRFFKLDNGILLKHFKRLADVKLKSKNNKSERLQQCHTGLLGLGAVVRAYPYDVPNVIPELLMILSAHVHDPQPVQKTVKDVLSEFKRTHHDNWMDHKQKFTDDQLVVLTNLLVSPSYYA